MAFHLRPRFCRYCNQVFMPEFHCQVFCNDECKFWSKVSIRTITQCWPWKGRKSEQGYGYIDISQKGCLAHRLAWEYTFGTIPNDGSYHGICVCHKCDNKGCVNPFHLFLGTNHDNILDAVKKGIHPRGEKHGSAKLTENNVKDIRRQIACGRGMRDIGREYNVCHSTIMAIRDFRSWAHI